MKKFTLLFAMLALLSTPALAQYGMMGSYGGYGGGFITMGLLGLIYLALASFVFATIFWLVHNWLVKDKKR